MTAGRTRPWWEAGVVYQIYPRSFQDTDGDGVGDLAGITQRLDHLVWLGVDAIWLSPVFRSPMRDFGYDIADYRDVDPVFGSLADLDRLIAEAHARDLRVILDFVPNHTSSDHPWFQAARSSRTDPKRDWYIWADPAPDGGPPNDWRSIFGGGPAWTFDEASGQYWFHTFLPDQPELDWRNPEVRAAMLDVLRFWFDRGVDGFRIDVLPLLAKDPRAYGPDPEAADRAARGEQGPVAISRGDGPGIEAILAEIRAVADAYGDRVLIGELFFPFRRLVAYYGTADLPGIHLPFNFHLIVLPTWEAGPIREAIVEYERHLPDGAWPNWVLGNHDQPRVATRLGPGQARVAAVLLLTLRGTPTLYYGDELGMVGVEIPPERIVDVDGRDPERTPMRWDASRNGGFTTGEPWLPMGPDVATVNVAAERADPRSMLQLHRRLLAERRARPALAGGSWTDVPSPEGSLAYLREADGEVVAVVANLVGTPVEVDLPVPAGASGWRVVLSSGLDRDGERATARVTLRGDEALVLEPAIG